MGDVKDGGLIERMVAAQGLGTGINAHDNARRLSRVMIEVQLAWFRSNLRGYSSVTDAIEDFAKENDIADALLSHRETKP